MKSLVKKIVPERIKNIYRKYRKNRRRGGVGNLPSLSSKEFRSILIDKLGVRNGDTVFIHSAFGSLNTAFDPHVLLQLLLDVVGSKGTLIFPTYPELNSFEFLKAGELFDARETPSFTGIITELARRHPDSVRSLHPTKSVVAIGPRAKELTEEHSMSPFPYDRTSPYYKIIHFDGKLIGLGVWTYNLSFVHAVDDTLRPDFPLCPYHESLFRTSCIDTMGLTHSVASYAHNVNKIGYDTMHVPIFMKRYVPREICSDLLIQGRKFFCGNAAPLFNLMVAWARQNVTIYLRASKKTIRKNEYDNWLNLERGSGKLPISKV